MATSLLLLVDMKILGGASKVSLVKKRFSLFIAILFGFVGLGLTPALAVDERVVDVVAVTWAGAGTPAGGVNEVARVINSEVNADWKKFTTLYGDTKERTISFVAGKALAEPISLVSKMACTGFAASEFLSAIRPEAYKRLGISDFSKRYLVVIAPKKLNPNIHIYTIPKYGLQRTSLNIPIQGCSNSETRIYELVKGATVYKTTIDGSDYIAFTPDAEFKKIGSYQLHKPTALNIVNPHGIINLSDEVRISLSLRFVLEPSWLYE